MQESQERPEVAVIGAGPAGLMAAEVLATGGAAVTVHDRMPSPGRKLLMAGRGGLNLTHSEPLEAFLDRYGPARDRMAPMLHAFPPAALVAWAEALKQETFIGSSGRVFPRALKASPLLRAWLGRLAGQGVALRLRHHWAGWDAAGALTFAAPEGPVASRPAAVVLALGGASWPRLGSDGGWAGLLPGMVPLRPANCGFAITWSPVFRSRFAGTPLKRIALSFGGVTQRGEAVVTEAGIEGGAVYALSAALREAIATQGPVTASIDLRPDVPAATLARRLDGPRGGQSLANHLRRAGLPPVAIGLVQEALHAGAAAPLSALVKALPLRLTAPAPLARAISTAGGLGWDAVDGRLMLRDRPGVFACGEMLDWEAPTGGYLLQGCFATGMAAGRGALDWLGLSAAERS
ncbi:NAD(FAD)-utilizing dehydrogenase [Siccirubricoccus deserti]|uniref:TIGR03862 family flavoprotein n=1 Tax=Siccirubricoccus deserti TaxID=2013562 RepID=A0A9X0R097_9PROT|nr:TIGR03862 family flavoprotein [Siccirubricoccus deserti]MBC4017251.1 TIGR03862 family flavoprotein [Siccirubricoccus deserti]GGC54190.1 NAD(FAD)-utilizing dehydrogenase [Siccirubricoccus deserti]